MSLPLVDSDIRRVLDHYGEDMRSAIVRQHQSTGFSGANIWRLETLRGPACLRRWPAEHPPSDRLEFIQAVLWHVDQEGFRLVPVPWETTTHAGYVDLGGHLWEVAPWLPGSADFHESCSPDKLAAAMVALARFHQAASSFPLPTRGPAPSPGILERRQRLETLRRGGVSRLAAAARNEDWPEAQARAREIIRLFELTSADIAPLLDRASLVNVAIQPCIRDVWHDHILFQGDVVSGMIDFGAMRPESVATDIARLLGSLVEDDQAQWRSGIAAYESVRPLSTDELFLIEAFDRSAVTMSGLQWIEWIYGENRSFANQRSVIDRLDVILRRLRRLAQLSQS